MAETVKTKAPTGLAIKRNKNVFSLTWKKGDKDYGDGQACVFRCNSDKFANQTISAGTTSKSVAINYSRYYPTTSTMLSRVQFGIRGNRAEYEKTEKVDGKDVKTKIDPTVSDWSYAEFTINKPQVPSVSTSLSDTYDNVCTFSWTEKVDTASHTHFADCQYQTILVKESTETNGSKLPWSKYNIGWQTGTSGASHALTITEQTDLLVNASYTRWVRVRARGARGASDWRYMKHVYARPNQARIKTTKVSQTDAGGYLCTVEWVVGANAAHPIDKVTVQYALAVPMPGMVCPDGASWVDASVTRDTAGTDKVAFSIDTTVGDDQCLFVRVNTEHDSNITYGAAKVADVGYLTDPSGLSVSTNDQTYLATVTATNNSAVTDSYLLIRYISTRYPTGLALGIIPYGEPSATVQCPAWASGAQIGFSVQAIVGAYKTTQWASGPTKYDVKKVKMRSRNRVTSGGSVPMPPTNVQLTMTDTVGTIQVSFDWSWQDARAAELSWANHDDAWQSTDEPETYTIDNTNASVWNISGLEVGQTWYVRVRLIGGTEDNPTYGGYSDTVSIDLSSEPITPVMTVSPSVVTEGDIVTASWVYVSTDGTAQASARIDEILDPLHPEASFVLTTDTEAEVGKVYYVKDSNNVFHIKDLGVYAVSADTTVQSGKIYYTRSGAGTTANPYRYKKVASPSGNPHTRPYYEFQESYSSPSGCYEKNYVTVAHAKTAQHVDIDPKAQGWGAGETHYLVVRVASTSKRTTGWSDPVPVYVAEPLECTITETSLVEMSENLIEHPYQMTSQTLNGITVTVNDDYSVTVNGTATANVNFRLQGWTIANGAIPLDPTQEYVLEGCPSGGSAATYCLSCRAYADGVTPGSNTGTIKRDVGSGVTIANYAYISPYVTVFVGTTVEDITFHPVLRVADDITNTLTALPLTATVTGAGEGTTTLSIVRAETYHVTRPDESDIYSFEGETVATYTQMGEAEIVINREDLIGRLDDGAPYRLVATVQDGLGQTASAEMPFVVAWDHQAEIPDGTVTIDTDHLAAMLVPVAPEHVAVGDTCDIYRLSVDKPQLVYEGATYGQTYVDPYPAVGEYSGYRFVMKTIDGDYITVDNELAWTDVDADVDSEYNIIDFDGGRAMLIYNIDVSNKWKKDFKETQYLGGSVQGDWNPAVSRTSSVSSVAISATDRETIETMRRLATHAGLCHVRTKEGSSYSADVQVSESYAVSNGHKLASFSLSITRVDPDDLDGMTLAEWEALHTETEEE